MQQTQQALRNSQLFADLPSPLLDQLAESSHRHTVAQGELLFHQGEEAHSFIFILNGRLRLVQHSADGKDVTMSTFITGEVMGLVVALLEEPYPGSAEALEACEVLVLPREVIWQIMGSQAGFALKMVEMLAAGLHEAHNRIRELSAERVQQRIARSLLRLVEKVGVKQENNAIVLDMRLSRQDLAQMNGTTLETVSRILTAWERDGIVDSRREQIVIVKPHALVVIAEDLPH